jgi:hypothetical protein
MPADRKRATNDRSNVRMRVATFLPVRETQNVRLALSGSAQVLSVDSWSVLESTIKSKPISVVVFDPATDGVMNHEAGARLLQRYPSLPFVAYVSLSRAAVRAVMRLTKYGLEEVVLVSIDDTPELLKGVVQRAARAPLICEFLTLMGSELALLPPPISQAVQHLFHQPHQYASAQDVAFASGSTVSCLYRRFHSTRLGSPKRVFVAARVLRGYVYLTDGFSVRDAGLKSGYRHGRTFAEHTASIFGFGPSRLRRGSSSAQVLQGLHKWLTAEGSPTNCTDYDTRDADFAAACEDNHFTESERFRDRSPSPRIPTR